MMSFQKGYLIYKGLVEMEIMAAQLRADQIVTQLAGDVVIYGNVY
jgi:hypothetical protein